MAENKFSLAEVIESPIIKIVTIALAFNFLMVYIISNKIPGFPEIATAIITVAIVGYLLTFIFQKATYINVYIIGVLAFAAYKFAIMFFKFSDEMITVEGELVPALVFGLISIAVFWIIKNYGRR